MAERGKTIFDFLNDLTFNKVKWEDQTEPKKFQPYMVHRWLSMNLDYLDLVAECLPLTSILSHRETYKFYMDVLPKKKSWVKYISNKSDKDDKFERAIEFIAKHNQLSIREATDYFEFILENNYQELVDWIKKFGYNDKQIQKEFGL